MSADTRCCWAKKKTLSKLFSKWECLTCGQVVKVDKNSKPADCAWSER